MLAGRVDDPRFLAVETFSPRNHLHGEGIVVLTNGDEGMPIARLVVEAATGAMHPAFDFL